MNHSRMLMVLLAAGLGLVLIAAENKDAEKVERVKQSAAVNVVQAAPRPEVKSDVKADQPAPTSTSQAATYQLNWYSLNSGGAINATSSSYQMGLSVGQSVAGQGSSSSYNLGVGFWYGAAGTACPITLTGDVNNSGSITSADIIYCVNFVFRGGPAPIPCSASADVNCSGSITSADIIYLVNFTFRGGPAPCDACASPLAASC